MRVNKSLKRLLQLVPGKQRFGVYRFLPFFFLLGGAMEWFMINVRVGQETFSCILCRRAGVTESVVGKWHRKHGLCVHEHCLYLATWLAQRGKIRDGICRFLPADIKRKVKDASK